MDVLRRVEKLRRFVHWRYRGGDRVPLWWHVGRPNFGDDINPSYFEKISGRGMRFAADRRQLHILGVGSILEMANAWSIVCGSGFLTRPRRPPPLPAALVAVRGELSRAAFDHADDVLVGDPLVLVDAFIGRVEKRHSVGLVPHVRSIDEWRARNTRGIHLVDPAGDPWEVVRDIASCDVVVSQSLHGLVVADALGVPNVWVASTDAKTGGPFKFEDYFSTLDRPKECVPDTDMIFARPESFAATVCRYRHSKDAYRRRLAAAWRGSAAAA